MRSLIDLQRQFRAALFEAPGPELISEIRDDGLGAARRLQIHRNNLHLNLVQALEANFPATCRIVDQGFFRHAAAAFIGRYPPRQPRLAEYGAELPQFLGEFAPAAGLPWLFDLGRLEWAMLECQEASEAPALRAADLEGAPVQRLAGLRLRLHPACRLLASDWPVDEIRSFALSERESPPPLQGDSVRLLVYRHGDAVIMRRLSDAEFGLLERLASGQPLGDALEACTGDAAAALALALRDGFLAAPEPASARGALTEQ